MYYGRALPSNRVTLVSVGRRNSPVEIQRIKLIPAFEKKGAEEFTIVSCECDPSSLAQFAMKVIKKELINEL